MKLCPYHTDSLGWDECSEGFEGCEIEKARDIAVQEHESNEE
jgi:hypothetical protein